MPTNSHTLCYGGLADKIECGVGFPINEGIAGNIDEFYSINERVADAVTKQNMRYRLKVVQAYAPTSNRDEEIEHFYENVEFAIRKVQTQNTVVMGNFNAKAGGKQAGEQAIGNYGIDFRNARGEMLVEFAERNRLRIMNPFFRKRSNRKWA